MKKKLINLALVVLSIFVATCIMELSLRLVWHNPYETEIPQKYLKIRVHHGRTNYIVDRKLIGEDEPSIFRTDKNGYIYPYKRHRQPDYIVAFLGGSTTECFAVKESHRFPVLVSDYLNNHFKVNTINAGHSGNTTHDSINILLNQLVSEGIDVAILMHASNDIGYLKEGKQYYTGELLGSRSVLKILFKSISNIYFVGYVRYYFTHQFEKRQPIQRPILANEQFQFEPFVSRLKIFGSVCKLLNIKPIIMTQPSSNMTNSMTPSWYDKTYQDIFNNLIRKVCREENIILFDLAKYIHTHVDELGGYERIFYDGIHVTDLGSQRYAEYISKQLKSYLRKRKS